MTANSRLESRFLRTRLTPPRPHKHTLHRPRLTGRLLEAADYRLTVVQAGTGYGKTTALAALGETAVQLPEGAHDTVHDAVVPLVWYRLDAEDADSFVFLLHLLQGFAAALPGLSTAPLAMLEQWERSRGASAWAAIVDSLVNALAERLDGPLFLVLDDAHRLNRTADCLRILDRLIGRAPRHLHAILSARYPPQLPSLVAWRVKGELLEIGQTELAFTAEETAALFREQYGLTLTPEQVDLLAARVEGWVIALHLVWQRLQNENGRQTAIPDALGDLSGSAGDLFVYLAQEVLAQQPADIRAFLQTTAVLRQMTAAVCDCLRRTDDSAGILRYLLDNALFVVDLGGGHVRYHHLFHDLLRSGLPPDEARAAHRRAAACYRRQDEPEEALHHLLAAGDHQEAAAVLEEVGRRMVGDGRLDTLAGWIGRLPPEVLESHPPLLAYLGDVARLHSRFDEALGWYQQAEARSRARGDRRGTGQALRGQARVYLDTVNPSQAEQLLQEALRLSDGQEDRASRARLLELLAENLLNQGRSEEAARYQVQARDLRAEGPGEADLPVRLLLRTGRLDEARRLLEEQAGVEREAPVLRPRAHRETLLLLSLVLAFQGKREAAYRAAVEGTERGRALESDFITAVGFMRQGHAWLLQKENAGYEEATRCFQAAIDLSERLSVPRLKVEANWGLCQAHGFRGELALAGEAARQGIAIAQSAGDEWVEACIRASMGASCALAGDDETAVDWLAQAGAAYRACGDTYGEAATQLWQCLIWHRAGDEARLARDVADLLCLVRAHGYDYLFRRRTLLGPPDPRALVPLLLFARERGRETAVADRLLARLGLSDLALHPGYGLRVQTLGPFRLWRGREEVAPDEWGRKKARQLFLLLLTTRRTMLEREQIVEKLWPELDPEQGERDFKIAYSAMCRALEPGRKRNAPSAFVTRDGSRYGLRPEVDMWLDAAEFDRLVARGDRLMDGDETAALDAYREALVLYDGEYLQGYPYEEWCSEERERLLTVYLRTAERLANALLRRGAWQESIDVCNAILARDACWEQAYRTMMQAYAAMGNRTAALRAYQRCVERLQAELGIEPMPATVQVVASIR